MKFARPVLVVVALGAAAAVTAILAYRPQPKESTEVSEGAPAPLAEEAVPEDPTEANPSADGSDSEAASQPTTETNTAEYLPDEPPVAVPSPESLHELVPEDSEVEWEAEPEHATLDDTRLSETQRQAIQTSPVPVLLPDSNPLLSTALISTGDYFYAASMDDEDVTVVVSGASRVVRIPGAPEPPAFGDHELTLTRNEGIVELSFKSYGVYYDVTVECFQPFTDPRCTQDAYLLDLADGLMRAQADKR